MAQSSAPVSKKPSKPATSRRPARPASKPAASKPAAPKSATSSNAGSSASGSANKANSNSNSSSSDQVSVNKPGNASNKSREHAARLSESYGDTSAQEAVEKNLQDTDADPEVKAKAQELDEKLKDPGQHDQQQLAREADELKQKAAQTKVTRDQQGRTDTIDNSTSTRDYDYFGETDQIKSMEMTKKEDGSTTTWSRENEKSNRWTADSGDGGKKYWYGDVKVNEDGVHMIRPSRYGSNNREWQGSFADGTKTNIRDDQQGNQVGRGENNKVNYFRDQDGRSRMLTKDQLKTRGKDGKESVWNRDKDGNWTTKGSDEVRKEVALNDRGQLTFTDAQGRQVSENFDGSRVAKDGDGRELHYDAGGQLNQISHRGRQRFLDYQDGKLQSFRDGEGEQISHKGMKVADNGDVSYKDGNGGRITHTLEGTKNRHDKDGFLTEVSKENGRNRTFEYEGKGKDKQLSSFTDTRQGPNGERVETWTRGQDGAFHSVGRNGRERTARENVQVQENGDVSYTRPGEDQERTSRVSGGGETGFDSGSVEDAHYNFRDTMEGLVGPERLQRIDRMMAQFEKRMSERAEARLIAGQDPASVYADIESEIAGTYDQMAELAGTPDGPGQLFDQQSRVALAENYLYHVADPMSMDQGQNGTCWLEAGIIAGGLVNNPQHVGRFLKEVALTSSYTSHNLGEGDPRQHTFQFNPRIFGFSGYDEEGRWTLGNAHRNGMRSPVGLILDEGMSAMVGRGHPDAGRYGGSQGVRRIMYMVTGDVVSDINHLKGGSMEQTLLEDGAFISYQPGHMLSRHLIKDGDSWALVQDNQWGEHNDYVMQRFSNINDWSRYVDNRPHTPFNPGGTDTPIGPGPSPGPIRPGPGPGPRPWGPTPGPGPGPSPFSPGFGPFSPGGGIGDIGGGGGGQLDADDIHDLLMALLSLFDWLEWLTWMESTFDPLSSGGGYMGPEGQQQQPMPQMEMPAA